MLVMRFMRAHRPITSCVIIAEIVVCPKWIDCGSGGRTVAENKSQLFTDLYEAVHDCTLCIGAKGCKMEVDPRRVRRRVVEKSLGSRVFIVGQALGPNTQRLSGIPYMSETGNLSTTGNALDI